MGTKPRLQHEIPLRNGVALLLIAIVLEHSENRAEADFSCGHRYCTCVDRDAVRETSSATSCRSGPYKASGLCSRRKRKRHGLVRRVNAESIYLMRFRSNLVDITRTNTCSSEKEDDESVKVSATGESVALLMRM